MNQYTPHTLLRAKFKARLVVKVSHAMAQHDIRYYLNGIRVESASPKPGVYIVACDGCRLLAAYDPEGTLEGDDGQGLILRAPPEFIRACALPNQHTKGADSHVLIHSRRVCVAPDWSGMGGQHEVYVMPGRPFIEGKYPNWRGVLPDFTKLTTGFVNEVNVAYLGSFAKVLGRVGRYGMHATRFWQERSNGPIVVQFMPEPQVLGILMPMRDEKEDVALARLQAFIERPASKDQSPQSGTDMPQNS